MTFQIGDKVLVTKDYMGAKITGLTAIVIGYNPSHGISLEFEETIKGVYESLWHSCKEKGKYGYCWNVPSTHLELAEADGRSPIERKCRRLWNKSRWAINYSLTY
jgi:hypothetical protein